MQKKKKPLRLINDVCLWVPPPLLFAKIADISDCTFWNKFNILGTVHKSSLTQLYLSPFPFPILQVLSLLVVTCLSCLKAAIINNIWAEIRQIHTFNLQGVVNSCCLIHSLQNLSHTWQRLSQELICAVIFHKTQKPRRSTTCSHTNNEHCKLFTLVHNWWCLD